MYESRTPHVTETSPRSNATEFMSKNRRCISVSLTILCTSMRQLATSFTTNRLGGHQLRSQRRIGGGPNFAAASATTSATSGRPTTFPIYYNDVYHVPLPKNHRFPMEKYGKVRRMIQAELGKFHNDSHVRPEFRVSPLVSIRDLQLTHCEKYIDRFLSGDQTKEEQRNVGFPWSPASVDRALSSTGGTVAAARFAVQQGPWACHVAGGTHHAFYDYGEGFCVFSDIAVAANAVLREFDHVNRILILDLDVHQGNGNAVLFQNEPGVFTFSLHCSGNYFSAKQQSDLDIELPIGCNDETYLTTLYHWLQRLRREADPFDLIFFQAGVDIHENDRLGRMAISSEGIKRRNQLVFDFVSGIPSVICMGGGYPKGDDWSTILDSHTAVYVDAYHYLRETLVSSAAMMDSSNDVKMVQGG